MAFLPSGLYAHSATAALFNAATHQENQQQRALAYTPIESGIKRKMMTMAFAPVEKKIELYSWVG
jgi:hypothetical protein